MAPLLDFPLKKDSHVPRAAFTTGTEQKIFAIGLALPYSDAEH